jgi:formylmethanofuran dehydrogenase subunit C
MASYSFSLQGLHHLILSTPHDDVHVAKNLGVFVSAGYNLLPDEEIYYDLETPYLSHLGYRLRHKHLIIDGTVNSMLGYAMIGRLTINGTVGVSAGSYMTGTLVNNGATGHDLGKEMIGVLTSNKKMSNDGTGMLGVHNGQWVSAFAYINWPGLCERFKKSLTFALTLPDNEIRRYLRERYMYDGELYEAHR